MKIEQVKGTSHLSPYTYHLSVSHQGKHGMYGHWMVNFDEYACMPYWGAMKDLVRILHFIIIV